MGNKRILIVDDDPDIRQGMQVRLEYGGYDTCFAADALSGESVTKKEKPDLIVLDLGLPAGDGFLLINRLKMHHTMGRIPIIVVSARDARTNRERAITAGATAYLQKPVDNVEFLAVIRKALGEIAPASAVSRISPVSNKAADKEARSLGELAAVRENFLQRTRGELPLLRERLARIQEGDSTGLAQLQNFAHRIHGSGAIFDFAAISQSAGQIERLCEVFIGNSVDAAVAPLDLKRLVECGRQLTLEIGAATTQESGVYLCP
jgi:DNA-binding response OmpR family regulator